MTLLMVIGSGCAGGVSRDYCSKFHYQPKTKEFKEWVTYKMPPHLKKEFIPDIGNSMTYREFCL